MNAIDEAIGPETFEFDDLSDKAKERARDKFREHHLNYNWWEHVYDEAKTVAELFGMEIAYREERHGARIVGSPDIRFNGFHTQGSGACWNGIVHTDKLAGAIERVQQYAPNDNELMLMAQLAEKLYAEIAAVHAFNRLCDDETNRDWPEVEIGMNLPVNGNERNWSTSITGDDVSNDIEKIADELVDDFGGWIHSQLEDEYEYQMADEQIDAAIDANAMLFDEDGNEL